MGAGGRSKAERRPCTSNAGSTVSFAVPVVNVNAEVAFLEEAEETEDAEETEE